jgi:hypothetical protein
MHGSADVRRTRHGAGMVSCVAPTNATIVVVRIVTDSGGISDVAVAGETRSRRSSR